MRLQADFQRGVAVSILYSKYTNSQHNASLLRSLSHQGRINSVTHCPASLLSITQHVTHRQDLPIFLMSRTFPQNYKTQWQLSPLSIFFYSSSSPFFCVSPSHCLPPTFSPASYSTSFLASSAGGKGWGRRGCPAVPPALTAAAGLSCLN